MQKNITVLIIDGGARGHAISEAYEKSARVGRIIVAPGNDFIGYNRKKEFVVESCNLKSPESILAVAKKYEPDLVDVAQDDALAGGAVDLLRKNGFLTFGATRQAARIEWDKKFSREFMLRQGIPAPRFMYFDSEEAAGNYAKSLYEKNPRKIVFVKAAGLCSGKGALKAASLEEALARIVQMKSFGEAGKVFLIEDGLAGEEFSYYAISDGSDFKVFKSAQDNKTVFNFDEGDQTGGMGAVSPALVTEALSGEIEETLISRAISGMKKDGVPYRGILYLGGIVVDDKPINIEYNARWGDPECQAVLPSVENYAEIVLAALDGKLNKIKIEQDSKTRCCVVGASKGYPNDYSAARGKRIFGIEEALKEGVRIFGAGIDVRGGKFFANGGRLFSIVAEGKNILEARQKAYSAIAHISVEGNNLHFRTDIGWRDVEREAANFSGNFESL